MRPTLAPLALSFLALAACTGTGSVGGHGGTGTTSSTTSTTTTGSAGPLRKADKIDILLGIDNSRSMADKQEILTLALSDLVQALTNPPCLDSSGQPVPSQPATGRDACPEGSARLHLPIDDIHIGLVSTSIGGHGADACPALDTTSSACAGGVTNTTNDDHGHLVYRKSACGSGAGNVLPTYADAGFLAWDPNGGSKPPGEGDPAAFAASIQATVIGAGQLGCGYEAQLESWYRFLVDPEPYASLSVGAFGGPVTPVGVDDVLLAQRKAFLRPDSLLAILMLSDENDCSIRESDQYYLAAQQKDPSQPSKDFHLPRARADCAVNPSDPCCRSCATDQGTCPPDAACAASPLHVAQTDDLNLRCWDQKRRFGIDFLYPVDRYVNGLSSTLVPNRAGELVANPIYENLDPATHGANAPLRDPGLVVLAGIVGVPWQDLARDPKDLTRGYKTAAELAHADGGNTTWDVILGDPPASVPPLDPHMLESTSPRTGTNPITGDPLAPTTAAPGADPINGHEYTSGTQNGVQVTTNDLQYACIFPLLTPRECGGNPTACDCTDPKNDNPLCEPSPTNPQARTLQARAKAYPGLRQLHVLRDLGPQGVAASICPAQQTDPTRADYAYRPAIAALVTRVRSRLPTP